MNPLLPALAGYVALQLAIGVWVSRRIRTEDDYLVAGRRMGPGLAGGTIFATWFGAETCLGGAGEAYSGGLSLASAEPFAYGLCIVFLGLVFARRLWEMRLTTLADFFRRRYSPGVEQLAACLMIPTSLLWAAAQVRAFGQVLATSAGLSIPVAIALAAAVVVAYTAVGGLLADAITDVLQAVCLVIGLGVILFGVVQVGGGWSATVARIASDRVTWLPREGGDALGLLEAWSVPILGSVVAQELVVRVSAARSARVARGAALTGGALYVAVGCVPVFLGLVGPALAPDLADSEAILPELARVHLSTLGYALFTGALVSAILSTVDSTLLVCSSLLSHNLVLPRLPRATERTKVRLARAFVAAFGALAFVLALTGDSVSVLVELASSVGSSGLFVILTLGLFGRRGGPWSAHAALWAGLAAYAGAHAAELEHPFLTSLAAAFAAFGVVSVLEPARTRVTA